jgi:hypothetical protein
MPPTTGPLFSVVFILMMTFQSRRSSRWSKGAAFRQGAAGNEDPSEAIGDLLADQYCWSALKRTAFTGNHTGPLQLELLPNIPVFDSAGR